MLLKYIKHGWYIFALWACRMFCVVFFRMHLHGQENVPKKGAFLLVSNHQSNLDPVFCGAPIRRQLAYAARESLFKHWGFRMIIRSVGTIPIKRDTADLKAMRRLLGLLLEGYGLCLFPEGTRTSDGKINSLQPGVSFLSRKTNAPIIPVVIDGAFQAWPRHKQLFTPWMHIWVWYGKRIEPEFTASMSDKDFAEYLTGVMRKMLNDCREKFGKSPYEYEQDASRGKKQ